MIGPKPPARYRRSEATIPDAETTATIANRLRREVALERASGESEPPPTLEDAPVVVVVGPDGIPEIAEEAGAEPKTVRWEEPTGGTGGAAGKP
jgi:hypothetical protein